jgi:MFS family permease
VLTGYGNWIQVIIGVVNFLPCIPAYFLIQRFGRKSILTWGSFGMLISLIPCGITLIISLNDSSKTTEALLSLIFLCLYIISFATSLGPLCWTYMTEVMTEKALSIGVAVNLILTVTASMIAPILFKSMEGYVFIMCAVFAFITFIFCIFVLKETKGLNEKQIQQLFSAV